MKATIEIRSFRPNLLKITTRFPFVVAHVIANRRAPTAQQASNYQRAAARAQTYSVRGLYGR